jgi:hypothetical protein
MLEYFESEGYFMMNKTSKSFHSQAHYSAITKGDKKLLKIRNLNPGSVPKNNSHFTYITALDYIR